MIINNKKLKEIYVPKVRPPMGVACEHFYAVPNAEGYVLSDYGRLYRWGYRWTTKGGYNRVYPHYSTRLHDEACMIRFNDEQTDTEISMRRLLALVFYPEQKGIYLESFNKSLWWDKRWSIYGMHVLTNQSEIAEAIAAKCEQRDPTYDDSQKGCTFINRFDPGGDFRKVINRARWGMISRGSNPKIKIAHPTYKNTRVNDTFRTDQRKFGQWYIDNWYAYPTQLQVDKDLLGFGEADLYDPQYMTFLPVYINKIFTQCDSKFGYSISQTQTTSGDIYYKVPGVTFEFDGYRPKDAKCSTYVEALGVARKMKADYIRRIVSKERSDGYMPDYVLRAMEQWANLCELGLVKKWEPSAKALDEMGVLQWGNRNTLPSTGGENE